GRTGASADTCSPGLEASARDRPNATTSRSDTDSAVCAPECSNALDRERSDAHLPAHPEFPPHGGWRGGHFDWTSGAVSATARPSGHRGDYSTPSASRGQSKQAARGSPARHDPTLWPRGGPLTCGASSGGLTCLGPGPASAGAV